MGAELFHADRRWNRHDEANSRFLAILRTRLKRDDANKDYVTDWKILEIPQSLSPDKNTYLGTHRFDGANKRYVNHVFPTLQKCVERTNFWHTPYLLRSAESFLRSKTVPSQSRNSPQFMEPEGSLPHLQMPANCPYSGPDRSTPCPHIPILEDPPQYYPPIYAWVSQVVSFPQVSPPKSFIKLSSPPYALQAPPISFFLILSPEQNWVRGTDH